MSITQRIVLRQPDQNAIQTGKAMGRRRFMPKYSAPGKLTPFAQVLTDYMWNRRPPNRPPMTTPQLAIKLGLPKQNVNNWIMRGSVPPLTDVLTILAQLDIPMSALYDAYRNDDDQSVPRWDEHDTRGPRLTPAATEHQPRTRGKQQASQANKPVPAVAEDDAPEPRPYTPVAPSNAQSAWERMVIQSAQTLRDEGLSEDDITAAIAHILQQQMGAPSTIAQRISAEHSPQDRSAEIGYDEAPDKAPDAAPGAPGEPTRTSRGQDQRQNQRGGKKQAGRTSSNDT